MQIHNHALYPEKNLLREQMLSSSPPKQLKVAIVGGSNSVMRYGYTKYLQESLAKETGNSIEFSYFSLGGVTSLFGVVQNYRFKIAQNHDVILFEYCLNDRGAFFQGKYSLRMAGMALEGFIRQAKSMNPSCIIVVIIFGMNVSRFYDNCCQISAVYESIARRYEVPVINLTEIFLQAKGFEFIKQLYLKNDDVHFEREKGVKVVGKTISKQIIERQLLKIKPKPLNQCHRMYADNLQSLKFFDDFDSLQNQTEIEKSVFKNSLFEECIYTIRGKSKIELNLKGKLLGIMLKSDWYDGLIKIKFGKQEIITSSLSEWIISENKGVLSLLSLPYQKFYRCSDLTKLSISICQEDHENFKLDIGKKKPMVAPERWKLSIIGIAYWGEISTDI